MMALDTWENTVFGKLNYLLKLRLGESLTPVTPPVRRISFSRRENVVRKLQKLKDADVNE